MVTVQVPDERMLGPALLSQFRASWDMLRQAVDKVPDGLWHRGSREWYFSLTAYHVVETMDFYSRDTPEGMRWGGHAGFEWSEDTDVEREVLPKITKEIVISYLDDVSERLTTYLSSVVDADLRPQDGFHWFSSIFEKLVYLLRHSMHHTGELARMLREWGCERVKWV